VVIGHAEVLDELPVGRIRTVVVDDPATVAALGCMPSQAPDVRVLPEQLAYVIFTSGSTGRPKGVQVRHGGVVSYVSGVADRVGIDAPGGRFGLLQPLVTDFGNTVWWLALTSGGSLVVMDGQVADAREVAQFIAGNDIEVLKIVPSHLASLAAAGPIGDVLPSRVLMLGGEAATPALAGQLLTAADAAGVKVINHYGPSETTVGVAAGVVDAESMSPAGVPIGWALPNDRLFVVDESLSEVPIGVVGELLVGGAGLARGYAGRADLTA